MKVSVPRRFAGPPTMGHGGYVAGLFAGDAKGAVQVTLRRPTPLDVELDLVPIDDDVYELRHADEVIAESKPAHLVIDPPPPPSADVARAAEPQSPSFYNGGRGVHPTCFGCGNTRTEGDALRIFAAPLIVDGRQQVAAPWTPGSAFAGADGRVAAQWVAAALDCPGAFAFIADEKRAGLLGRIVFEQYHEVSSDREYVVTGWQIGEEGRKLFAGTALFDETTLVAAAHATWFGPPARR